MSIQKPSGIITGPNLISCISEISLQDHDNLTHCTQIATHSADLSAKRYVEADKWLDEYVKTMNFLGWSVYQDAIFTRTRHDVSDSVAQFLILNTAAIPDAPQRNALIDTLDALKYDKPAMLSLDQETLLGERFQVIPARYDSKGILEISVLNLELVAYTKTTSFLFFNSKEKASKITQQRARLKLDKRKLESKRAFMEQKLNEIRMRRFNLRQTDR